jgi:uncharacterized protein
MLRRVCLTLFVASGGLVLLGHSPVRSQPSFDCGKAASMVENAICGDEALQRLDARMAAAFRAARERLNETDRRTALDEQRRWLRAIGPACEISGDGQVAAERLPAATRCLSERYNERIAALEKPAAAPVATSAPAPVGGSPARLAATIFPASSRQETILTVEQFGRYAITVKSPRGTALQLIDFMDGPGAIKGSAGREDGRLDAFLDRGSYKLVLLGADSGAKPGEEAQLTLHPFTEVATGEPPVLPDARAVATELADFQQRSYWIKLDQMGPVILEAAGRHLADLRLWRDGAWLVDTANGAAESEPKSGEPFGVRRLNAILPAGLYKVVAYGGPGKVWTTASSASPLFIRRGFQTLSLDTPYRLTASPFGADRYLVPGNAGYARLELPESQPARLALGGYSPRVPFAGGGAEATIAKENRLPRAEVSQYGSNAAADPQMVTVEAAPGESYELEILHEDPRNEAPIPVSISGRYWLSVVPSGPVIDSIDETAILLQTPRGAKGPSVVAATALPLTGATRLKRRFNLLETTVLFVRVEQAGDYRFTTSGDGNADFLVEPLIPPEKYRRPAYLPSGKSWALDEGYYRVTIAPKPEALGIVDLTIDGSVTGVPPVDPPRQFATRLPSQELDEKGNYVLWVNRRPEIRNSVILRSLPDDLAKPLPVLLAPKDSVEVKVTVGQIGKLSVAGIDGKPLPAAIDGQPPAADQSLASGAHSIVLKNDGDQPLYALIAAEPPKDPNADKLPELPRSALNAIPVFPKLAAGRPAFGKLASDGSETYAIEVPAPGLYRLESTGLLATSGSLRNRVIVQLAGASANGVGRNFLIQQYLSTGSYQVTLTPTGSSAGDYGATLSATPVEDGGDLTAGVPARTTLKPGHSLAYSFDIPKEGRYRLETLGLNRQFAIRLEDSEGWPVIKPNTTAPVEQTFRAGRYRVVLLPQALEGRVVTSLAAVPDAAELTGHGPFALPWAALQSKEWLEPEAGQPRTPDQWRFTLPAPAEVAIDLAADMAGTLTTEGGAQTPTTVTGGKLATLALAAGAYRFDVVSARPDNRRTYTLRLDSTELLAGQRRPITAPAMVKLSVGAEQVIELGSFGGSDVRAKLFKDDQLIAANDDRPNDWNFAITRRLVPGVYRLQIDPSADGNASAVIAAQALDEVAEPTLAMPAGAAVADAKAHVYPLELARKPGLITAAAQSRNAVDLALERRAATGADWQTLATASGRNPHLAVLRSGEDDAQYRLRVWSTDHTTSPIAVKAALVTPPIADEALLTGRSGLAPTAIADIAPDLGVALVKLDKPGIFRLIEGDSVEVAASADGQLLTVGDRAVIGQSGWLALIEPAAQGKFAPIHAQRVDFSDRDQISLDVPASGATVALPPVKSREDLVVWLAESQLGQPSLRADGIGAAAPRSAIAIAPGLSLLGKTENALHLANGEGAQPLTLKLSRSGFAMTDTGRLDRGLTDIALPPGKAATVALASKEGAATVRLSLTLPARTMAILYGADMIRLLWSGDSASVYRLDGSYFQVALAHLGDDSPHASVQAVPIAPDLAARQLTGRAAFRELFATAGIVELDAEPGHLRVFGGEAMARFNDSERVLVGGELDLPSPAHIAIRHETGLVVARLDPPSAGQHGGSPVAITALPVSLPLSGDIMSFAVPGDRSRLIELVTTSSVMATTTLGSAPARLDAFADGAKLSVYAPQGQARFDLEPAGPGALSGVAQLRATPIVPISEGLGPKVRLAPGEARGYSFSVPDRRRIGVGVRASVDVARCRLLDAEGKTLGVGVTQLNELPPGDYVLLVEVPLEAIPVDVEPALVGVKLPDTGPPDDVKRNYLALVGRRPKS